MKHFFGYIAAMITIALPLTCFYTTGHLAAVDLTSFHQAITGDFASIGQALHSFGG
jgi:hypothetical protein